MAIKGQVKYPGYKTNGKIKQRGLRNNRSADQRKKQEATARQKKREEWVKEALLGKNSPRSYR